MSRTEHARAKKDWRHKPKNEGAHVTYACGCGKRHAAAFVCRHTAARAASMGYPTRWAQIAQAAA